MLASAMAGHRDENPFSHDDDINPFAKLKNKRQELEAKEAELNKREEILRRREEALAKSGAVIRPKNWPSFYPIVHHDIAGDIPLHLQRIQYVAFAILLGVPISLFWNVLLSIAIFASGTEGVFVFFSIIYFLLGPLGAFYFWYRPLYRAFRTNNGTSFGCFFFNFFNHIVFFSFAAIGPRIIFVGLHFAGILNAMSLISGHLALGIMSFIGFGFFTIEVILSIWVFRQVYRHFRGSGGKATTRQLEFVYFKVHPFTFSYKHKLFKNTGASIKILESNQQF
ncbi:hypothetical protein L1887_17320 [Cichorium endivia]|nr:hypothetical protein L1887_17320 [Cichorium endivia]